MMDKFTQAYLKIINEAYSLKHPFSFSAKSQQRDEQLDKLKAGEECDAIICRIETYKKITESIRGDEFFSEIETGSIECPPNLKGKETVILKEIQKILKDHDDNNRFMITDENKWKFSNAPYGSGFLTNDVKEIQLDGKTITVLWENAKNIERSFYHWKERYK